MRVEHYADISVAAEGAPLYGLNEAFLIRPVRYGDLSGLLDLARLAGPGFTSLQPKIGFLNTYINMSVESFRTPNRERAQKFLLVLVDRMRGTLAGCAAVKTNIGLDGRFVNFQMVDAAGHDVSEPSQARHLEARPDFARHSEVGSLFLHPDYRGLGLGQYLARSRYLLMAHMPTVFGEHVMAELRGVIAEDGTSAFYKGTQAARLGLDFAEADQWASVNDAAFLSEAMPTERVEIETLPPTARAMLGRVNPQGQGAYDMLIREGCRPTGAIDLLDGGPIVAGRIDELATLAQAQDWSDAQTVSAPAMISGVLDEQFTVLIRLMNQTDDSARKLPRLSFTPQRVWRRPARRMIENAAPAHRQTA